MIIDKNTVAKLAYSIQVGNADGAIIENTLHEPKDMLFGFDKMISGFESNLYGMEPGSDFNFNIDSTNAFGDYRNDMVVDVPKQAFMVNGSLREDLMYVGNEISMMDNSGRPLKGRVTEIMDETVKMDFNHPLAGEALFVTGKVIAVREITPEDLQSGSGGCGSGCGCGTGAEDSCSTEKEHSHAEEDAGGGCCGGGCGC